jgi:putative ABC transport system permease protein
MKIEEMFNYAVKSLRYAQLRSWLTIIGIVIAIASIVLLLGIAQGLKQGVNEQLKAFGSDTIAVTSFNVQSPAFAFYVPTKGKLWEKDYEKLKKIAGIELISKVIGNRASVTYKDETVTATVGGVEPSIFEQISTSMKIKEGRFLRDGDRHAAVLGGSIAEDTFSEDVKVGQDIKIGEEKFRVVGILEKTGSSMSQLDNYIFVTFDDGKELFRNIMAENEITIIRMKVSPGYDVEEVGETVKEVMRASHRVGEGEEDFSVITPKYINEQVDSVIGTLSLLVGAVAGIGLIVGGIGISNTMFTSVLEKTQEIGTLKAIGMKKGEIVMLFLIEAGIIGLVGGVIGIIIAFISSILISFITPVVILPEVIVGAAVFAFVVGLVAGAIPAKNAAEIPAAESLRYE